MGHSTPIIEPSLQRAIALSHRRHRQIWVIWTGTRIALRNSYRRGRGLLVARVAGDEIFACEATGQTAVHGEEEAGERPSIVSGIEPEVRQHLGLVSVVAGVLTVVAVSRILLRCGFISKRLRREDRRPLMIRPALRVAVMALAIMASAPAYADVIAGKVVRVLDGDTVEILVERHPIRVRLASIDAPEIRHGRNDPGQPFGVKSQQSLASLVARQNVITQRATRFTWISCNCPGG